jgi:hypothetical protein
MPENKNGNKKSNRWLSEFANNTTSQYGENGIIEKVLEVINNGNRWCVEFGSWDGKNCSNTYDLISNKGYSAVLIEADKKRYRDLLKTFAGNYKVIPINTYVGFDEADNLDTILTKTPVPENFDLLSIDIDGNDYHVWNAVKKYRPKVVVIEFNPTIPTCVEFVQPKDMSLSQGSSLLSITNLGKSKGYELVAVTEVNAIFVLSEYYRMFKISDNSPASLREDESSITYIFSGYDGTVFLRGCGLLPWQQIPYKESKVQQLPKWARKRIGDKNFIRRNLGKYYRRLKKKKTV